MLDTNQQRVPSNPDAMPPSTARDSQGRVRSACVVVAIAIVCALFTACKNDASTDAPPEGAPPVVAVTGRGEPAGAPTSASIGPEGGKVTSSDGALDVVVPAGALAAAVTIGVQPITSLVPGGKGLAYRLTPDGQKFTKPVELVMRYTDAEIEGTSASDLEVAYQDGAGRWVIFAGVVVDSSARRVVTPTTHFTDAARRVPYYLSPVRSAKQPNERLSLTLFECTSSDVAGGADGVPLGGLANVCSMTSRLVKWFVNGVHGGDSKVGGVTLFGGTVEYTAPAAIPPKNPVEVSAEFTAKNGKKLTYSALVDIGGHPRWKGSVNTTIVQKPAPGMEYKTSVEALVTWSYDPAEDRYRPEGTLTYNLDITNPPCTSYAHDVKNDVLRNEGNLEILDGTYSGSGVVTSVGVEITQNCPPDPPKTSKEIQSIGWWPGGSGALSPDGMTITGTAPVPGGGVTAWTFTRQ